MLFENSQVLSSIIVFCTAFGQRPKQTANTVFLHPHKNKRLLILQRRGKVRFLTISTLHTYSSRKVQGAVKLEPSLTTAPSVPPCEVLKETVLC